MADDHYTIPVRVNGWLTTDLVVRTEQGYVDECWLVLSEQAWYAVRCRIESEHDRRIKVALVGPQHWCYVDLPDIAHLTISGGKMLLESTELERLVAVHLSHTETAI